MDLEVLKLQLLKCSAKIIAHIRKSLNQGALSRVPRSNDYEQKRKPINNFASRTRSPVAKRLLVKPLIKTKYTQMEVVSVLFDCPCKKAYSSSLLNRKLEK